MYIVFQICRVSSLALLLSGIQGRLHWCGRREQAAACLDCFSYMCLYSLLVLLCTHRVQLCWEIFALFYPLIVLTPEDTILRLHCYSVQNVPTFNYTYIMLWSLYTRVISLLNSKGNPCHTLAWYRRWLRCIVYTSYMFLYDDAHLTSHQLVVCADHLIRLHPMCKSCVEGDSS